MCSRLAIIVVILGLFSCNRNIDHRKLLQDLMASDLRLKPLLAKSDEYEIQIIYTQIDRDSLNNPTFTTFTFSHLTSILPDTSIPHQRSNYPLYF
jgi:hypothetical protein